MSTRLINAIEHRKCHRRPNKQQNIYDIKMKRLQVIQRLIDIRRSYPLDMINSATRVIDEINKEYK